MNKIKSRIFLAFFIFFCTGFYSPSFCDTNSMVITTYFPSPYAVYNELRAKRMTIGDDYIDFATSYCWEGTCANTFDSNADLIVQRNVGIGTGSPALKFHVNGDGTNAAIFMNGNVGIGTLTPTQALDVIGYLKDSHPYFIASATDGWRATSGGWIAVVYNYVLAGNSGGWYSTGTGSFTAPVRGIYLFIAQHYIYSGATGGQAPYIHHAIGVNGNLTGAGYSSSSGSYTIFGMNMGTYDSSTATLTLLYLNAGDYVNDNVYVAGSATYMFSPYSYFQGVLLYAQ